MSSIFFHKNSGLELFEVKAKSHTSKDLENFINELNKRLNVPSDKFVWIYGRKEPEAKFQVQLPTGKGATALHDQCFKDLLHENKMRYATNSNIRVKHISKEEKDPSLLVEYEEVHNFINELVGYLQD